MLAGFLLLFTACQSKVPDPEKNQDFAMPQENLQPDGNYSVSSQEWPDSTSPFYSGEDWDYVMQEESDLYHPETVPDYKQSKPIEYLLLTSDQPLPLLLADTARKEKDIPFLAIPRDMEMLEEETPIRFGGSDEEQDFSIQALYLSKFIAYMRPLNVIILGDEKCVPEVFRGAVPEEIPVVEFKDRDWKINAMRLQDILYCPEITEVYETYWKERNNEK